jgi:hypothetical protein
MHTPLSHASKGAKGTERVADWRESLRSPAVVVAALAAPGGTTPLKHSGAGLSYSKRVFGTGRRAEGRAVLFGAMGAYNPAQS